MYYTNNERISQLINFKDEYNALTLNEHLKWKRHAKNTLGKLLKINSFEKASMQSVFVERTDCITHFREKWIIETEPLVFMPFYVLLPKTKPPYKAIIAPHGHLFGGKEGVAGNISIDGIKKAIETYNCNYGEKLVKEGFAVFCPDSRGFGERRENERQGIGEELLIDKNCLSCTGLNRRLLAVGQTLLGCFVFDLMCLADYIYTRDDCVKTGIGCVGLSGGGMQALYFAALDKRVKVTVVSGYFYGAYESLFHKLNCSCNYVPSMWKHFDLAEIGALVAPRHLVIETGDKDPLNGKSNLLNVLPQVIRTKKAYSNYKKEDAFLHHIFDGGHRFCGAKSISFIEENL